MSNFDRYQADFIIQLKKIIRLAAIHSHFIYFLKIIFSDNVTGTLLSWKYHTLPFGNNLFFVSFPNYES